MNVFYMSVLEFVFIFSALDFFFLFQDLILIICQYSHVYYYSRALTPIINDFFSKKGKHQQLVETDDSPPASDAQARFIREVVGVFLYYARGRRHHHALSATYL